MQRTVKKVGPVSYGLENAGASVSATYVGVLHILVEEGAQRLLEALLHHGVQVVPAVRFERQRQAATASRQQRRGRACHVPLTQLHLRASGGSQRLCCTGQQDPATSGTAQAWHEQGRAGQPAPQSPLPLTKRRFPSKAFRGFQEAVAQGLLLQQAAWGRMRERGGGGFPGRSAHTGNRSGRPRSCVALTFA